MEDRQSFSSMYKNQDSSTNRELLASHINEFSIDDAADNSYLQNILEIFKPTRKLKPSITKRKKVFFI